MNSFEGLIKQQKRVQKKKELDQQELGNLYSNTTTIKNFFQSKQVKVTKKTNLEANIKGYGQEVANYDRLMNFIAVLNGQIVINQFKKSRLAKYKNMLNSFGGHEIFNMQVFSTLSVTLLQLEEQHSIVENMGESVSEMNPYAVDVNASQVTEYKVENENK